MTTAYGLRQHLRDNVLPAWLGRPYKNGSADCLNLLWAAYPGLPREFRGLTADTYAAAWKTNPEETRELLYEYIYANFEEVFSFPAQADIQPLIEGDILFVEKLSLIGIYIGGGLFVIISEQSGCQAIKNIFTQYAILRPRTPGGGNGS